MGAEDASNREGNRRDPQNRTDLSVETKEEAIQAGDDPAFFAEPPIKPVPSLKDQQLSLFDMEWNDTESGQPEPPDLSVPQQFVDTALRSIPLEPEKRWEIADQIALQRSLEDNSTFIQQVCDHGTLGLLIGRQQVAVSWDERGVTIGCGKSTRTATIQSVLSWEQAAETIERLVQEGRYLPQTELDKIRAAVCEAVLKSGTSEEFIRIMLEDYQIRVKESRGRWSYLPEGRKQAVTHRRLGDAFSKEMIETAIRGQKELLPIEHPENKVRKKNVTFVHSEQKLNGCETGSRKQMDKRKTQTLSDMAEIDKVINLEKNTKARDSEAYAQWIKIHNLQEQAKTFRFLSENDLLDSYNLDAVYASLTERFRASRESMKETERQIKEQNNLIRLLAQYYKGRDTYRAYRKAKNKKQFKQEHQAEHDLYKRASKKLKEMFGEEKLPSMQKLKKEKAMLQERKKEQYTAYQEVRKEWLEIGKLIQNRDSFLSIQTKAQGKNRSDTDLE